MEGGWGGGAARTDRVAAGVRLGLLVDAGAQEALFVERHGRKQVQTALGEVGVAERAVRAQGLEAQVADPVAACEEEEKTL